jgi:hypothetical protein
MFRDDGVGADHEEEPSGAGEKGLQAPAHSLAI